MNKILNEIKKFRMNEYIEYYKNNKNDRDLYRKYISSYKTTRVYKGDQVKNIISNYLSLTILIFLILIIPTLLDNSATNTKGFIAIAIIVELSIAAIIALPFKTLQCNYLLMQFDEIDNDEKFKNDSLQAKIAACNLYLK